MSTWSVRAVQRQRRWRARSAGGESDCASPAGPYRDPIATRGALRLCGSGCVPVGCIASLILRLRSCHEVSAASPRVDGTTWNLPQIDSPFRSAGRLGVEWREGSCSRGGPRTSFSAQALSDNSCTMTEAMTANCMSLWSNPTCHTSTLMYLAERYVNNPDSSKKENSCIEAIAFEL